MTFEILIVLALLVAAMVIFATEWLSIDAVALGLVAALVVSGVLTPAQAFQGFGSEVIVILACVMVLAGAIVKAGVMTWLGRAAHRLGDNREGVSMLVLMAIAASSSALFSNTNTTAVLTPVGMEAARRATASPSRFLMPIAFASILGGSCTLIGTSTNLAGSGMVERLGFEPFSLFEFLGIGAIIAIAGLAWLFFLGRRLVPDRRPAEPKDRDDAQGFVTALTLQPGSPFIGKAIADADIEDLDVTLVSVLRAGRSVSAWPYEALQEGDRLLVRASRQGLLQLQESERFDLERDGSGSDQSTKDEDRTLVEALVTPQSRLVGRTLRQLDAFERFRGRVLAVYTRAPLAVLRLDDLRLRAGDVLLLQGAGDELEHLRGDDDLRVLLEIDETIVTPRQGMLALTALAAAMVAGAAGLAPLSIAMLMAVLGVVVSGVVTMEEAYRLMEWRLLVLIAGMTSFGLAMETSGAAQFLADQIVAASAPFGPTVAMGVFALLTVVLTQPMSNAAAALTVIPVAVAAADGLGLDPRTLAILVTLSASLSFITPLEPASLLVYGPGRYRFLDFVRAGAPLTAICIGLLIVLVPLIWP